MTSTASHAAATDQELLAQARAGDVAALEALLGRHQGALLRFSRRMCDNAADAEEVTQESLIAAVRGLADFRGDATVTSWLYAIARSFCIKQQRGLAARARRSHTTTESAALDVADPHSTPDQALSDRELFEVVDRVLSTLSADHREVLLLRDMEGLTAMEVAASLSLSVPQVKSRLHRARAAMRATLTPLLNELQEIAPNAACPDIAETFSHYLEGDISPDLCDRMQAHVDSCAHCRNTCDSLKRTLAICHAVPIPTVPAAIQEALRAELRKFQAHPANPLRSK